MRRGRTAHVATAKWLISRAILARSPPHSEMDMTMDSRPVRLDSALLTSFGPDHTAIKIALLHREARAMRDAELARLVGVGLRSIGTVLRTVASAIVSWPRKRATYTQLSRLSDRELTDIGMVRGDIARVFEPDFVLPSAANSNRSSADKAA